MSIIETPDILEDPPVLTEAEQQLLNAERYMNEHGWCREQIRNSAGRVCARGALLLGNYGIPIESECEDALDSTFVLYGGLMKWNDQVCKNKEDAIDGLRRARALIAREREA